MTPEMVIAESMFSIVDKDGTEVPFSMNSAQRQLDENGTGRDIVPKARQEGVSTYYLLKATARCLMRDNYSAVIISHEDKATQRLLQRCKFVLDNFRGPSPVYDAQRNVINFPKKNSRIWIGTAGAKRFGRGDTINMLHCSEYAYWPNPADLLGGALQAVPMGGDVSIESTGNGVGNDYHRRCKRAWLGQSQYACHFLNWQNFPEYNIELSPAEQEMFLTQIAERDKIAQRTVDRNGKAKRDPEQVLYEKGLTAGQLVWRRLKLEELDFDEGLFKQEYPMSFDECFRAAGNSIFTRINYEATDSWMDVGGDTWILDGHPNQNYTYCIGADPSGGVGERGDNAVLHVACLDTQEQVGEYVSNKCEPDLLGLKMVDLGRMFNNAFLVPEANNHGAVTCKAIRDDTDYPDDRVYYMQTAGADFEDRPLLSMGLRTTGRTRPVVIGNLRTEVATSYTVHSPLLHDEMGTFVEHETGKMAAAEGCHDDTVIAAAMAVFGMERAGLYARPEGHAAVTPQKPSPFSLDGIIEEMHAANDQFPIGEQHASAGPVM